MLFGIEEGLYLRYFIIIYYYFSQSVISLEWLFVYLTIFRKDQHNCLVIER